MAPALPQSETRELPAMLTIEQVCEHFSVSKSGLHNLMNAGTFPRPERIGRRIIRWNAETLNRWIEAGCPAISQGT